MDLLSFFRGAESKLKAPIQQALALVVADAKAAAAGHPLLSFLVLELDTLASDPTLQAEIETAIYSLLLSKRAKATAPSIPQTPASQPVPAEPINQPAPAQAAPQVPTPPTTQSQVSPPVVQPVVEALVVTLPYVQPAPATILP